MKKGKILKRKIDKTYESLGIYPLILPKGHFSVELLKTLKGEIKPCIRPEKLSFKDKPTKNGKN